MAKWSNAAVCKTAIRGFDSHSSLVTKNLPLGRFLVTKLQGGVEQAVPPYYYNEPVHNLCYLCIKT